MGAWPEERRGTAGYRIGADIGGTFTDIVFVAPNGSIATQKVPSTPDDYGRAILEGIRRLTTANGLALGDLAELLHASTIATNVILEKKGARTALITTQGFRDVLELRRIRVPRLYEPLYEKPPPLVPRRLRFEVRERIGPKGQVIVAIDTESVHRLADQLETIDIEAVAVAFLHSYVNPIHEEMVGAILRERLPGRFVTLSAEVLPEIREYERTSTTVINAYIGPAVKHYLGSLQGQLAGAGVAGRLLVMQSSGGILDIASIMQRPAQIVESGPAAGVIGAAHIGRLAGYRNIITLDMGGTTAKASLIENGEVVRTNEYEVGGGISLSSRLAKGGGYALKLPVIDVSEVGAGGGSIVWIDQAGSIKVGPRSAGAVPGPVCYGAGGTEPTVTDANVLLGYLNSTGLAGGSVPIDVGKAQSVLDRDIARPLNQNVKDAAFGIHRLATTVMMRAVKAVSTYRGRDPREFTLFAFGGNGGVHAVELARQLHMRRVVVPLVAGAFSALGLLLANMELTLSRAFLRPLSGASGEEITAAFHDLEKRVLAEFGQRNEPVRLSWHADMRYSGQAFELRIPVEREALTPKHLRIIAARFEQEHQTTYGHRQSGEVVTELVTLRVTGAVELDRRGDFAGKNLLRAGAQGQAETRRLVYFGPHVGDLETPVIDRRSLGNEPQRGPIIVEEYESTIVIPPDATACLDDFGNVVVDIE